MPDLSKNQFHTDVEHQDVSSLFKDWLTCDGITKNTCSKAHGEDANPNAHHHHPDLIRERDRRDDVINTEDQVHQFNSQDRRPKRLDFDRLNILLFLTASSRHIFEVVECQVDEICCANNFDPGIVDEKTCQEQHCSPA